VRLPGAFLDVERVAGAPGGAKHDAAALTC
jgi:hypothetical protein